MDLLKNDTMHIHDEFMIREASLRLALKQSGLVEPPLIERALSTLGETLIRLGTSLKEHSYHKLTSEEASAPTFLIML